MNIEYSKHINKYDPVAVRWQNKGQQVELSFDEPITALFSKPLDCVIVELYSKKTLNFYSASGELISSEPLPEIKGYQFRGINKNLKSSTGVSFLFHPIKKNVGNDWGDTEQYELQGEALNRLGKKLGIYR